MSGPSWFPKSWPPVKRLLSACGPRGLTATVAAFLVRSRTQGDGGLRIFPAVAFLRNLRRRVPDFSPSARQPTSQPAGRPDGRPACAARFRLLPPRATSPNFVVTWPAAPSCLILVFFVGSLLVRVTLSAAQLCRRRRHTHVRAAASIAELKRLSPAVYVTCGFVVCVSARARACVCA